MPRLVQASTGGVDLEPRVHRKSRIPPQTKAKDHFKHALEDVLSSSSIGQRMWEKRCQGKVGELEGSGFSP